MNIVIDRPGDTVISTNSVYMAIYGSPTVPRVVPKHAWRIPMMELKRLEAGDMLRLGMATARIDFAHQEALKVGLEAGRWIWGSTKEPQNMKSKIFKKVNF